MQQIYIDDFIDKSHFKYLKYILGVNKKSTNLAVLSELGRYPLYFSVVLSMLKYWFRIDNMESGLLSDAYIANQSMVSENTECWLSSIKFILQKLNIQHTGIKLNELVRSVRKNYAIVFQIIGIGQSSTILLNMISLLSMYNRQLIIK
jgi:hypothetical protein